MRHLLLIALGPVQAFIAAARRSRDLRYGSWWLSELSKAAARKIAELEGLDALVFPAPTQLVALNSGSVFNVGNKLVAVIDGDPAAIAKAAEDAVCDRLETLWKDAKRQFSGVLTNANHALEQIRDLPEFYWVAVPINGDYDKARRRADALLAARKSLREFKQPTWGGPVPKSSLSGAYESLIHEDNYPQPGDNDTARRQKVAILFNRYGARAAERLSAVDLLKRHGLNEPFPSTSHLAALPYLHRLTQLAQDSEKLTQLRAKWEEYYNQEMRQLASVRQAVTPQAHSVIGPVDGSLLYESRLDDILEDQSKETIEAAKARLRVFLAAVDQIAGAPVGGPQPYYALLLGDGDGMGAAIESYKDAPSHQAFSRDLTRFAGQVDGIMSRYEGALVYAGGDDVMAFLPLHTALACAIKLAETFRGMMTGLTFSAGIAIAHHLEPLANTLALARSAEKRAKEVPGKNALAISVDKRSGVTRTISGQWGTLPNHLRQTMVWLQNDALPMGTAYHLQAAVLELGSPREIRSKGLTDVLVLEFKRIIQRRQAQHGQQSSVDTEVIKELEARGEGESAVQNIVDLIDELIIAGELARAATLAGVKVIAPQAARAAEETT